MKIDLGKNELIHFVGIGGIGMSGLALIMSGLGYKVQGSDIANNKNIEKNLNFIVGQMLWFQQPPGQQIWNQRIIHEGMADGNFRGFIYDKKTYILIAGNQFNVLGLYWTMSK